MKATSQPADQGDAKTQAPQAESKLSFLVGWVLLPGSLALLLFGLGAYVGVHHPEMWMTRLVRWLFGLF